MKRIDTTQETATSWSPFKVESKAFMQDANKEMVQSLCRNIISSRGLTYSTTVPYGISGFDAPFGSDGAIFFNGELYIMKQNISSALYAYIDTTANAVADPTTFSDNTTHYIHKDRYLNFTNTLAGSLFAVSSIIDASFQLIKVPSKPVISTYTGLTNVSTTALTPLTLLFPTEISDTDNQFASGIFNAKQIGFHQLSVDLVFGISAAVTETVGVFIYKNAALVNRCYYTLDSYTGGGSYRTANLSTILSVTSITDSYTVKLQTINNQTVSVDGNINYNFISQ